MSSDKEEEKPQENEEEEELVVSVVMLSLVDPLFLKQSSVTWTYVVAMFFYLSWTDLLDLCGFKIRVHCICKVQSCSNHKQIEPISVDFIDERGRTKEK